MQYGLGFSNQIDFFIFKDWQINSAEGIFFAALFGIAIAAILELAIPSIRSMLRDSKRNIQARHGASTSDQTINVSQNLGDAHDDLSHNEIVVKEGDNLMVAIGFHGIDSLL